MSTRGLKKWALLLTLWLALQAGVLKAQTLSGYSSAVISGSGTDFEYRTDGTLIAKGVGSSPALLTGDQGTGTRMLWYPHLSAFRAGAIVYFGGAFGRGLGGLEWNEANIGQYSVSFGLDTTASGYCSTASGFYTTASGYNSTAMGGATLAYGDSSVASGFFSDAHGNFSTASGYYARANGNSSVAFGYDTFAEADRAAAFGMSTTASGYSSAAWGYQTTAAAFESFVIGQYNLGGGTPDSWVDADPIFEIGNGTSDTPRDALKVTKNGNMTVQGIITAAPGGDIPMYSGS